MKKKQEQKKQTKLPSFIQILTVALTIYVCSFIFTKVKLYSEILKILSVIILLGEELKEIINELRRKEKNIEKEIVILAILMLLLLEKFDYANISAIIFYIKKYFFNKKECKNTKEEINQLKNAKEGDLVKLEKGKTIYFDGILKIPKAYFLNQEGKRIIVKKEGKVSSGWINLTNNAKVQVETKYQETEYYHLEKKKEQIINTTSKKEERILNIFATYQKLIIVAICVYIILTFILNIEIKNTIYTSILFLTLIYTVNPTNLLINITNNVVEKLFRERIVVGNKNDLAKVINIKNYIFEKTKTLTVGDFRITEVETEDEEKLFYYLNYGEYFSNHPIKDAVLKYKACDVNPQKITSYKSYPNRGIHYKIDNQDVLIGNLYFMRENNVEVDINFGIGTIIYVAVNKESIGNILISDGIKYKTKQAIQTLKKTRPKHLAIISSDNERITTAIAKELKIKDHYSNLTEKEKIFWIRHLKEKYPYQTALIGSVDTKEQVFKEADISILLADSLNNINEKASIHLLDNDMTKLNILNAIIKEEAKKEKIYKIITILIFLLLNVLLIFNYLPLYIIITTSLILEKLENKTRKEG